MRFSFAAILVFGLVLIGCQPGQPAEPPAGWESDGEDRWWQAGVDTATAFRDMSDFATLGFSEREDGLRPEGPVVRNVQIRFLAMYRNHPEVMDSVFAAVAVPYIEREAEPGAGAEEREALARGVSQRIRRVFVEPRARRDRYDPPAAPDSLRGLSGRISMQIYLDSEGRPKSVLLVEGIHPTLDAIVMRNYSERSWLPAYLNGEPLASWVHPAVTFEPRQE